MTISRGVLFFSLAALSIGSIPAGVQAFPHKGIVQLSAGRDNTCALMADHHVSCWGDSGVAVGNKPIPVAGITSAISVTSGFNFACARLLDGTVSCWGTNAHGQLGNGTRTFGTTPTLVRFRRVADGLLDEVTAISAGEAHVCARRDDSLVWCWGSNSDGQIGNWTVGIGNDALNPIDVAINDGMSTPISNVVSITTGSLHSCAEFGAGDGSAACWGQKSYGRLGDGSLATNVGMPIDSPVGVKAPGSTDNLVLSADGIIAGGTFNTCALLTEDPPANNSIACWGDNSSGQTGNPYEIGSYTSTPAPVVYPDGRKLMNLSKVSAGDTFACALLRTDGSIACWGTNYLGRLGNDQFTGAYSVVPVAVATGGTTLTGFEDLATGTDHVCGLIGGNTVLCWGSNGFGQLGTGSTDTGAHSVPVNPEVDGPIFADNLDGN